MTTTAEPDLSGLVKQINAEHRAIFAPSGNILEHAIKCGELLIEAQKQVQQGAWDVWLERNVEVHKTTAYGYMRLARNKDKVLASGVQGIDPALELLSEGRALNDADKVEMRNLRSAGMPITAIADRFGVRKSTVSYWTSSKGRDRRKRVQRRIRDQKRRRQARTYDAEAVVRETKGALSSAYGDCRRALNKLDRYLSSDEPTPRQNTKALEAIDALYKAEDALVAAMKAK
jgi:hypothetical protein